MVFNAPWKKRLNYSHFFIVVLKAVMCSVHVFGYFFCLMSNQTKSPILYNYLFSKYSTYVQMIKHQVQIQEDNVINN